MILSIIYYTITSLYALICVLYYFMFRDISINFSNEILIFAAGALFYIILRIVMKKQRDSFNFFDTFTHEYTHLVFSFMTFNKVYSFSTTMHRGGEIKTKKLNPIIVLSPYTVPIIPAVLGLITYALKEQFQYITYFIIGIFIMQFFVTSIKDSFMSNQQDLKIYGRLISYSLIILSYIFILFLIYHTLNYSISYNYEIILNMIKEITK